jgi:hypothetical protein
VSVRSRPREYKFLSSCFSFNLPTRPRKSPFYQNARGHRSCDLCFFRGSTVNHAMILVKRESPMWSAHVRAGTRDTLSTRPMTRTQLPARPWLAASPYSVTYEIVSEVFAQDKYIWGPDVRHMKLVYQCNNQRCHNSRVLYISLPASSSKLSPASFVIAFFLKKKCMALCLLVEYACASVDFRSYLSKSF